jgi:hypothetical protein
MSVYKDYYKERKKRHFQEACAVTTCLTLGLIIIIIQLIRGGLK